MELKKKIENKKRRKRRTAKKKGKTNVDEMYKMTECAYNTCTYAENFLPLSFFNILLRESILFFIMKNSSSER